MQEKENILHIFKETKKAIARGDTGYLRNLSNQTTNTAALTHDPDNIAVAVIVYSLSKILERENYKKLPGWENFYNKCSFCIDHVIDAIKKGDDKKITEELNSLRKSVGNISGDLKKHIQEIFRKASINKASKIYEHGISMEKTAKLLGISMFELASYAGQKEEVFESPQIKGVDINSRIKTAMEIFK